MRIRKLGLYGFKSFPDRTVLTFDPGISGVVGPNGCGKSNIVDALKWCMGEQSARALRGSEMQDVIFAGSADRKPVGFAEVLITFEVGGGEPFPGEYARFEELEVGRRLHRNGSSEYLINGAKARRRDIIELFLDTGVGNNLYSFIEQGSIGKIVHATPLERRSLVDEAAGISKYKARRAEARSRLEATGQQLDRAADVEQELGRRLRALERQVVKAARFRAMRARVRQLEILLSLAKYADLSVDRRKLRTKRRETKDQHGAAEREVARKEAEVASRREELDVVESALGTWRDEVAELDARQRELAGARTFRERRLQELQAEQARAAEVVEAGEVEVLALEERLERLQEERQQTEAQLAETREQEARVRQAQSDAQAASSDAGKAQAELQRELGSGERALAQLETRLEGLAQRLAAGPARVALLEEELAQLQEQLSELEASLAVKSEEEEASVATLAQAEGVAAGLESELKAAVERRRAGERSVQEASTALRAARTTLEKVRAEQARDADSARHRVQAAISAVDRDKQARVQALERERLQITRTGQAELQRVQRESRARSEQWLNGVRAYAAAAVSRAIKRERDRQAEERAARAAELNQALAEVESTKTQALAEAADRRTAAVSSLREGATASRVRLQEQERSHQQASKALRAAESAAQRSELEVSRLQGLRQAARAASSGATAVRDVLPDVPTLSELLSPEALEAHGPALRERLLLPVVRTAEEVRKAAAAAAGAGPADVMWIPEGVDLATVTDRLLRDVVEVDDFDAAAELHARTRQAVVVLSSGERIDVDGRVNLGTTGHGRRAADLARQLDQAREASAEAAEALEAARRHLTSVEDAVGEAREAVATASSALQAGEREAQELADREMSAARDAAAEARGRLEAADASWRSAQAQRLEQVESEVRERMASHGDGDEDQLEQGAAQRIEAAEQLQASRLAEAAERLAAELAEFDTRREEAEASALAAEEERAAALAEKVKGAVGDVAAHEEREQAAREAVELLRTSEEEARANAEAQRSVLAEARSERQRVRLERESLASQIKALSARQATSRRSLDALNTELTAAAAEQKRLDEEREAASSKVQALQQSLEVQQAAVGSAADALAAQRQRHGELTVALARHETVLTSLRESTEQTSNTLAQAKSRVQAAADQRVALAEQHDGVGSELSEGETELEAVVVERAAAWDRLERERERTKDLRTAWTDAEAALRAMIERRDELAVSLAALEQKVQAVRLEVEALKSRIDERYQVSLPGLLDRMEARGGVNLESDPVVRETRELAGTVIEGVPDLRIRSAMLNDFDGIESWVTEVEGLRTSLSRLGEVNLAAIEEYEDVLGRHQDLADQRADLEGSVQRIRAAISKMNRLCRQRFRDAFDRVNERFQELYPQLVGGGSARLSLTDEEDLLETGVDIFVQPPGKRLQNLGLLSGGEKAMTAIAMLLSLFHVKPSPYCVLDEVDAPLDEANGNRFNEILREMSSATQFILVTHNRKTMECADTLYGITMPTPGVSRLVSVRIDAEVEGA